MFSEVVRNVPVLSQKNHALVSRSVWDMSLQSMIGVDVTEVEAQDPENEAPWGMDDEEAATADAATAKVGTADVAPEKALVSAAIRKRKLNRQLTGTEVQWFPHDNDGELLNVLCHEAGRPRGVHMGTPAASTGAPNWVVW